MRRLHLLPALLLFLLAPPAAMSDPLAVRAARIIANAPVGLSASCGGVPVEVRAARQQRAASTLKVAFALALIGRDRLGARRVATDADLVAAIVLSDNAAANRALIRAGSGREGEGVRQVQRILGAVGARRTVITGAYGHGAWKLTTAHDLRVLAGALMRRAAGASSPLPGRIAPTAARALLGLMRRAAYPSAFGAPGWTVAHKAGWLGGVENDLAIITSPRGARCAVALVSDGIGQAALARLGRRLTVEVLAPLARRTPDRADPVESEVRAYGRVEWWRAINVRMAASAWSDSSHEASAKSKSSSRS